MHRTAGGTIVPKGLILGCFCVAAAAVVQAQQNPSRSGAQLWIDSPYRNFAVAQPLLSGRVLVLDEADDASLRAALAVDLKTLASELHERQGWATPMAEGDPLRIFIARKEAEGVRRLAVRAIERGRLVSPAIQLDATGMPNRQIVREIARLYAFATLSAYGLSDRTFLTAAAAEYLSGNGESEEERERTRIVAAAPSIDLSEHASSVGRLYVEEFARETAGAASLRAVWEKAAETGQEVLPLLLQSFVEATGDREETLLLRAAARLYAALETEVAPSRIGLSDLETGGLDASAPAGFALRHRTYVPPAEAAGAVRILWPEQGASSAAVVRYRDAFLPPDVLFLSGGAAHVIPLSGVARVDFLVTGFPASVSPAEAPALVETLIAFPYSGLAAQAAAAAGGPRIGWTTTAHDGLAGWAIFREELLPDGSVARTGPQILPSSTRSEESFRYAHVDPETAPGTYYRYTVWAVTEDGLLAKAFSTTLRTPE